MAVGKPGRIEKFTEGHEKQKEHLNKIVDAVNDLLDDGGQAQGVRALVTLYGDQLWEVDAVLIPIRRITS